MPALIAGSEEGSAPELIFCCGYSYLPALIAGSEEGSAPELIFCCRYSYLSASIAGITKGSTPEIIFCCRYSYLSALHSAVLATGQHRGGLWRRTRRTDNHRGGLWRQARDGLWRQARGDGRTSSGPTTGTVPSSHATPSVFFCDCSRLLSAAPPDTDLREVAPLPPAAAAVPPPRVAPPITPAGSRTHHLPSRA